MTDRQWLEAIRNRILHIEPRTDAHKQQLDKAYTGLTQAIEALEALEDMD